MQRTFSTSATSPIASLARHRDRHSRRVGSV